MTKLHRIEQIKEDIKNAKYVDAKNNIQEHRNAEKQGLQILEELKEPIHEYQLLLEEISAELNTIENPNEGNRRLVKNKCDGLTNIARQHLDEIHIKLRKLEKIYFNR